MTGCARLAAAAGLFLYDHIGGRNLLPPTRSVDLTRDEVGRPLIPNRYTRGLNIPTVLSMTLARGSHGA
jgi:hypothetical protein